MDKNLKPHLKYFYAMQKYRDYIVVTVDDDIVYPKDMLESLYNSYKKNPMVVSARRVHRIKKDANGKILPYKKWDYECRTVTSPSLELFATGVGGVLYPPDILKISDENLTDIYNVLTADDIYLKYIENKLNIKVLWVKNRDLMGKEIKTSGVQTNALNKINVIGKKNDDFIKAFLEKKPEPQEEEAKVAVVEKKDNKINNFNDFFDHIYCLHYLPSEARLQKLKDELSRVGIDENAKYFSWVYDYPTSLLDIVYNDKRVNMSTPLKSSSRSYIKRVSMKHYEIIKEAYSLGYNRILILEDDIRFHKDLEYIKKMLANIPDSDIVMFDKMTCSAALEATKYKRYIKTLPSDSLYGSMNDSGVFFIFCSCYSLNRKAMKQIIDTQEQSLQPPDTPLNGKTLTGSFALINIAIQDPSMKTREVESYSKIDLDVSVYGAEEKAKTNPAAPVSQPPAKSLEKKIRETGGDSQAASADNKKPKQVVFRMPTTPQSKRRIEPTPKPASQTKRPIVLDKRKRTHTRILVGKSVGYNKLYET